MADKIRVLIISASNRGENNCSSKNPKSLELMKRMAKNMPDDFEVDTQSLSNITGEPKIQSCNACFLSPDVKVYGAKKWRSVGKFKKHKGAYPQVLAHTGKFRRTTDIPQPIYTGTAYTIIYKINDKVYSTEVTSDHMFLSNGQWIAAQNLSKGDLLTWVGVRCQYCGSPVQLKEDGKYTGWSYRQSSFCNKECQNKAESLKRKGKTYDEIFSGQTLVNMRKQAEEQRERRKGKTDVKIFGKERAKEKSRKLSEGWTNTEARTRASKVNIQTAREKTNKVAVRKNLEKYWTSRRGRPRAEFMGKKVDQKIRETIAWQRKGKTYEEIYGEEIAGRLRKSCSANKEGKTYEELYGLEKAQEIKNKILKTRRKNSPRQKPQTEIIVEDQLKKEGIVYQHNAIIKSCEADFLIEDLNLVLQVEGCYWHACKECYPNINDDEKVWRNSKGKPVSRKKRWSQADHRDRLLELEGYQVERIWEHELKQNPEVVQEIVNRVAANHNADYQRFECEIVDITTRYVEDAQTYCLTVEEDHSFVIEGGLISHNCVSTSMALCHWPCSCYGPGSMGQPDFMYEKDMYPRFEEADAWAIIGPINWYGPTSNVKAMFDRMVCMDGGNPFVELTTTPGSMNWKDTKLAEELEKSPKWKKLNIKHMEGRTCSLFTYGDGGANEVDEEGYPRNLTFRKAYEPSHGKVLVSDREAYAQLVAICRWMGIEVPDNLWAHHTFGEGKPYSDNQIEDIPKDIYKDFDEWTERFVDFVMNKGKIDPPLFPAGEAIKKRKKETKRGRRTCLVERIIKGNL